jgi:hypothetical protein
LGVHHRAQFLGRFGYPFLGFEVSVVDRQREIGERDQAHVRVEKCQFLGGERRELRAP